MHKWQQHPDSKARKAKYKDRRTEVRDQGTAPQSTNLQPSNLQSFNVDTKLDVQRSKALSSFHPSPFFTHRPIRLPNEHVRGHSDEQAVIKHAWDL